MKHSKEPTPYAPEKLSAAIHALVVGKGRIKERLLAACGEGVFRTPDADLPEDLAAELGSIRVKLTAVAATGDEGPIVATMEGMSESEALEIVRDIAALEYRARDYHPGQI